jgi:hypothetical protein
MVLTNTGSARTIEIYQGLKSAVVPMKENSIATLVWDEGGRDWVGVWSNAPKHFIGGQRGTRTPDFLLVRQAL